MKNIIIYIGLVLFLTSCSEGGESEIALPSGSESGSYANLLAVGDYLYFITESEIVTMSLADPSNPTEIDRISLSFRLESLFHYKGKLIVGSTSDMVIYEIGQNGIPELRSSTPYIEFQASGNFQFGDPITINDTIAYVTLATAEDAGGDVVDLNELRIYDISTLTNPTLINQVPMIEPKGVALDDELLFICEKDNGLKVFNVTDPLNLDALYHFDGFESYDVIAIDGLLLVVAPTELRQYDYTDVNQMELLSTINL